MRALLLVTALTLSSAALAGGVEGLVKKQSPYGVTETLDRLERTLEAKGITVVVRWSHGDRAEEVDIPLRGTELMVFGNPKLGSHLMIARQSAGIDLPMKALAWRDADGQVWLGYNEPAYIARRHGIEGRDETLKKMTGALDKLTDAALASQD